MNLPNQKTLVVACAALITCLASGGSSMADTIAYTYPAAPSALENDTGGTGMTGFEFTLNQNIDVTQLGFTALSLGGGDTPHVSLWSVGPGGALSLVYDTGNILSSVTSTGQGSESAAFSYVSVGTPIALSSGSTYLVTAPSYWAANFPSSSVTTASAFSSTSFVTDGGWSGSWANSSYAGFTGPGLGGTSGTLADFSTSSTPVTTEADFQYTVVAAPEPSTYLMFGLGLAALVIGIRRRSTKATL
jgi:hypothetical protein